MATPGEKWRGSTSGGGFGGREKYRQAARSAEAGGGNTGNRVDRWNRSARGGRGGNVQRGGPRICRFIEQGEHSRYGDDCAYSHDISTSIKQRNRGMADTPEQKREREDYNSWKRLIKRPLTLNDARTIELL